LSTSPSPLARAPTAPRPWAHAPCSELAESVAQGFSEALRVLGAIAGPPGDSFVDLLYSARSSSQASAPAAQQAFNTSRMQASSAWRRRRRIADPVCDPDRGAVATLAAAGAVRLTAQKTGPGATGSLRPRGHKPTSSFDGCEYMDETDDVLLTSGDLEDFGRFYDRYARTLLGFF
jgi:hypothetical protein